MARRERMVRVWEVAYDCGGPGPYGDGVMIARYRDKAEAERFAAGRVGPYGHGAAVARMDDVPRRIAERWGCA